MDFDLIQSWRLPTVRRRVNLEEGYLQFRQFGTCTCVREMLRRNGTKTAYVSVHDVIVSWYFPNKASSKTTARSHVTVNASLGQFPRQCPSFLAVWRVGEFSSVSVTRRERERNQLPKHPRWTLRQLTHWKLMSRQTEMFALGQPIAMSYHRMGDH